MGALPSIDRVRELIRLDNQTGRLFWRLGNKRSVKAGDEAGWIDHEGYRRVNIEGRHIGAHRIVFALTHNRWSRFQIDHINMIKDDNRPENLREATQAQNGWNKKIHSNNTSGTPGVHQRKADGKWIARVKVNGKEINLGSFAIKEDAISARIIGASKYFGEFARIFGGHDG